MQTISGRYCDPGKDPKSGIIAISVQHSGNPVLASNLAQGYVAELDCVVTNNSTSAARRERIFLEGRLEEIKHDLDDSSKALSQFSSKNRTIDIPSQGRAMVDSGLNIARPDGSCPRSELAALQQSYWEDNVRVRAAQARIAELQLQINKTMGSTEESKFDANDSGVSFCQRVASSKDSHILIWIEGCMSSKHSGLPTMQYETAKVQEAKEIPSVCVLDVADVPQHKSSPVRRPIVMLGALLSLVVALIAVFIISAWDEMDAQDERKKLVTEIVGAAMNSRQWYWSLPGMSWVRTRFRSQDG